MNLIKKQKIIRAASGKEKADIVIKNGNIVNVFTKEIIRADVAICMDQIAGIGNYEGNEEIDAKGRYICPGFIDSHVHIESTMVTPAEFAKAVIPFGTTTVIADPHEIANVCGINGINFMLDQSKSLPINMFFMIPSCVPATHFENNGAVLSSDLMTAYVSNDRILGLGEVMDYPSVLNSNEEMLEKISLFCDKIVDGHSPYLAGKELNTYRAAGVLSDHECSTVEEALERLRLGMYVQIREGSGAKNLETLITGLLENSQSFNRCLFCTDDKHLEDIKKEGHISYNVKKAIALGVDPIEAISMATINAAQFYKLKKLGAVGPGYYADLLILDSLKDFKINKVFYRGKVIFKEEGICPDIFRNTVLAKNSSVINTVRLGKITKENLKIMLEKDTATVIRLVANELITRKETAKVKITDGCFMPDKEFSKVAVVERHKATNNIGLGIVGDFNISKGAIAGTVAHDSHNLIVIGDNDEDMLIAIEELQRVNGGFTIVSEGKVRETLELPIAGLMSDKSSDYVVQKLGLLLEEAKKLEINKDIDPFITLSFLALPVIPEIRITDRGLFDVIKFNFI